MNISKDIFRACIKGKEKAQYQLYKECYNPLMRVCMRYTRKKEEALPLLNLAFVKIVQNLDKYLNKQDNTPFIAWIKHIMVNVIIDEYRKERKQKELFLSTDFDRSPLSGKLIGDSTEDLVSARELHRMLNELPEKPRLVFNLHQVEGYSHKEIVKMTGISERSSKRYLSEARDLMQEKLLNQDKICDAI